MSNVHRSIFIIGLLLLAFSQLVTAETFNITGTIRPQIGTGEPVWYYTSRHYPLDRNPQGSVTPEYYQGHRLLRLWHIDNSIAIIFAGDTTNIEEFEALINPRHGIAIPKDRLSWFYSPGINATFYFMNGPGSLLFPDWYVEPDQVLEIGPL